MGVEWNVLVAAPRSMKVSKCLRPAIESEKAIERPTALDAVLESVVTHDLTYDTVCPVRRGQGFLSLPRQGHGPSTKGQRESPN